MSVLSLRLGASLLRSQPPSALWTRFGSALYDAQSLGLDRYAEAREKVAAQMNNFADSYRDKMAGYVTGADSASMVFTEDLKNMLHLCTSERDLELVGGMVRKYDAQSHDHLRFGNFVFGPVLMRMYYHLDRPDAALAMYEDPKVFNVFDQLSTYFVLLNLLYKHERYDDVLRMFHYFEANTACRNAKPKNGVVMYMAACYKMNTAESLESASKLWSSLLSTGHDPLRKAVTFFAGLAVNQNAPHIALECLSTLRAQKYVTVANLKVASTADLNRPEDAIAILRSSLDYDTVAEPLGFAVDVIQKVKAAIERSENKMLEREFEQICKGLSNRQCLLPNTIDVLLCQEVKYIPRKHDMTNNVTNFQTRRNNSQYRQRPGLQELY